jgi:hypothetical protein
MSVSGTYTVTYSATDLAGNTGTATRTVIVEHTEQVKLTASDAAENDNFGRSVAISGDYAIVGVSGDDDGGGNSGSAYIFRRTGTNTWDAGTKIGASDAAGGDLFGESVAISGDYAIVGARLNDDPDNSGSAYIFRRTDINTWDAGTKIIAPDAATGDEFGSSVSISGNTAIVGAYRNDSFTGSAYIFRRTGTNTWDDGTKIIASDDVGGDRFGYSVGISGNTAIVGAYTKDSYRGSAYIFDLT